MIAYALIGVIFLMVMWVLIHWYLNQHNKSGTFTVNIPPPAKIYVCITPDQAKDMGITVVDLVEEFQEDPHFERNKITRLVDAASVGD